MPKKPDDMILLRREVERMIRAGLRAWPKVDEFDPSGRRFYFQGYVAASRTIRGKIMRRIHR